MNPFPAVLITLLILAALPVCFGWLKKRYKIHPELARKGVHVFTGLTCLTFPWIFQSSWPVLFLAVVSITSLAFIRYKKESLGHVLHGVKRLSYGEICFPLSVVILFHASQGVWTLYFVPLLILTLADTAGALVGLRYGQLKYTTDEGFKSLEGSIAFFLVAFLSSHLVLLLFTETSRIDCLLIGLLMGGLIVLIEAVSWRGLDNLFVPIISFVLLVEYPEMGTYNLLLRVCLLVIFIGAILLWKRGTYLNSSAAILVILIFYITLALGGWRWLLPPFMLALGYFLLCPTGKRTKSHDMQGIASVSSAAMAWFFIAAIWRIPGFYFPYVLAIGCQLGMIAHAYGIWRMPEKSHRFRFWASIIMASSFVGLPLFFVGIEFSTAAVYFLILILGIALAQTIFIRWIVMSTKLRNSHERWMRQGMIAFLISILGLIPALVYYSQP